MIIPDDHKRIVATIVAGRRAPDGERISGPAPMKAENVMDEDGEMDHRHIAAQDILAAHHEKSPEKLKNALAAFMDLHMAHQRDENDADHGTVNED